MGCTGSKNPFKISRFRSHRRTSRYSSPLFSKEMADIMDISPSIDSSAGDILTSSFDFPCEERMQRVVKAVLDDKMSRSNLSRLSEMLKINTEYLDDYTIRARIIFKILDFKNQTRRALLSPSSATLRVNNKAADNASAFDNSSIDAEHIQCLVKEVLNNKLPEHLLDQLSEILRFNIENLDDYTIRAGIIFKLMDLDNKSRKSPSPSSDITTLGDDIKAAAIQTSAFDFSCEEHMQDVVKAVLDNKMSRSNLSRLSESVQVNPEYLDVYTIRARIISKLSSLDLKTLRTLLYIRDHPIIMAALRINNKAAAGSAFDNSSINDERIQRLVKEVLDDQLSKFNLSRLSVIFEVDIENLDDYTIRAGIIFKLMDFDNKARIVLPSVPTAAITSWDLNNVWWEIRKYFELIDPESNESGTKAEPLKSGDCYIFNYQKFEDGFEVRPGSTNDVSRLRHDFQALDFNVNCDFLDLTKEQTLDILKQVAKKDHAKNKCFVCCFLTHGEDGSLLTSNGYLKVHKILECFSRSACESLAGKPKIFIFEACGDNFCAVEGSKSHKKVPDYQDFLLIYSTYEDKLSSYVEQEDNNRGSFFVNELCRTLEQFSVDTDLFQILTILNFRVAQFRLRHSDRKKHLPGFTSRITTELIFNKESPPYTLGDTKYFDLRRMFCSLGEKSTKEPLKDKKFYSIGHSKKIKFLLFQNTKNKFDKELLSSTSSLWRKVAKRGYRSSILSNWSKEELMGFSKEVVARGFANMDCLICFVVCKAEGQYLWDAYGKKILKKDLVEQFTKKESLELRGKQLRGKPKIFIFLTPSPKKETWTSCFFADIIDNDEDSTISGHSDLLDVTVTITDSKQLKDVIGKFSDIFGEESPEGFLSQLTKINKEFTKNYVLADVSKKSPPLKTEKSSPVTAKLPPTVDNRPQKPRNPLERMVQNFSSSSNPNRTLPRLFASNDLVEGSQVKHKSRPTLCFNSTLTATLILNNITVPT